MKKMVVAVHDGIFHVDDVFAIAILKKIYPNMEVVRTRDEDVLRTADMRVDIGKKYDVKTNDFDHHQDDSPIRESGLPYASCGLIWKHFGRKLVNSDAAFAYIDGKLVEFIDAGDNGVTFSNGAVSIYSIGEIIDSFNPAWNESGSADKRFHQAVRIASEILNREIERANSIDEGNKIVKEALKKAEKEFVVLPKPGLPKDLILSNPDMKFSIFPNQKGRWIAVAVPAEKDSFECRHYFPKSWAGLEGKDLEKASGVAGAEFCHKHRFMAAANTQEEAIEMVRKALRE